MSPTIVVWVQSMRPLGRVAELGSLSFHRDSAGPGEITFSAELHTGRIVVRVESPPEVR